MKVSVTVPKAGRVTMHEVAHPVDGEIRAGSFIVCFDAGEDSLALFLTRKAARVLHEALDAALREHEPEGKHDTSQN